VAVAIASTAAVLALFYVSWRLIRELGLPGGPGAILLTIFGSPLFYYSIFQSGYKHAFDALLVATLALFLLRASRHPGSARLAVMLGVILAVLISLSSFQIDALAPVKMLFTLKRGLFVWTPLTALGVLGYLLFLRRGRRDRTFLTGLGLSATAPARPHRVGRILGRRILLLAAVLDGALPRLPDRDRRAARANADACRATPDRVRRVDRVSRLTPLLRVRGRVAE